MEGPSGHGTTQQEATRALGGKGGVLSWVWGVGGQDSTAVRASLRKSRHWWRGRAQGSSGPGSKPRSSPRKDGTRGGGKRQEDAQHFKARGLGGGSETPAVLSR